MSTSISGSTPEPGRGKHRLEDQDDRLDGLSDGEETQQRRKWWPIVAVIAIALVLLQLAIFAFRNNDDEPADTDAASEVPVGESCLLYTSPSPRDRG